MTIIDRPTNRRARASAAGQQEPATARWLPIQRGAAAAIIVLAFVIQVLLAQHLVPPLVIVMALFAVATALTVRRPRGAGIGIGVLSALALVLFLPDLVRDLGDPASTVPFVIAGTVTLAAMLGVAGGVAMLRRKDAARAASVLPVAGVAVVAALIGVGVFARVTLDSHAAEAGDLRLVADQVEYAPDDFEADAGTVAVHVDNRDLGQHDFVIDELGVDLYVPGRTARRVEFEATPGTYTAVCTLPGHEDMEVTITVR